MGSKFSYSIVYGAMIALGFTFSSMAYADSLPTVSVCIDHHPPVIQAEVADDDISRARGLMMREQLGEHQGMWFRYVSERPGHAGFWMYNTWIPLDIAFLDREQRIVRIIEMQPCTSIDPSRCPVYQPNVPYFGALEMNLGYFAKHAIGVGTKISECAASKP